MSLKHLAILCFILAGILFVALCIWIPAIYWYKEEDRPKFTHPRDFPDDAVIVNSRQEALDLCKNGKYGFYIDKHQINFMECSKEGFKITGGFMCLK